MTYEPALREELSFGDICSAGFLYDVHVRADARAMGRGVAPAKFAAKQWGIDQDVPFFVPGVNIRQDQSYVLGHGARQLATVLSDDCLIATALGRDTGVPTNRRLLFAPVVGATDEEVTELAGGNFGRFPLPGDGRHRDHRIVDIRRCFMVDARDVHYAVTGGAFRVAGLDEPTRDELAIRWSAYALRRGPFVAEDSMEKLAEYLLDSGRVADEATAVNLAGGLVDVVAAAWGYEGRGVAGAGTSSEDDRDPQDAIDVLAAELEQLRAMTDAALGLLRSL